MSIKEAIFFVESFAHLQGNEKTLLPIAETARAEHEALLKVIRLAFNESKKGLVVLNMPLISPEWHQLAKAALAPPAP